MFSSTQYMHPHYQTRFFQPLSAIWLCVCVGGGGGIKERVVWVNEGRGMVRVQCGSVGGTRGGCRGELRKGWCE